MKKPFVTKELIEEVVKEYPTPFHIYDEKGIRENAKALKEAFSWNKGYKEFFAVKATPNPFLIDILREYGCGCDCSSMTELMLSHAMDVPGEDIMFSSNDTPAEEFAYAAKIGATINLDDITHIDFLEKTIGYLPKTLSCRYNPGGYFSIANSIMDNPGDAKYGFTTEQMFEGYKILKAKGVENFGIHAFLASNTVTNDYYPTLARELFELAVKLKEETGAHITFINLSGGIGIPYKPEDAPNDIRVIGEGVRKVYEEVLSTRGSTARFRFPRAAPWRRSGTNSNFISFARPGKRTFRSLPFAEGRRFSTSPSAERSIRTSPRNSVFRPSAIREAMPNSIACTRSGRYRALGFPNGRVRNSASIRSTTRP